MYTQLHHAWDSLVQISVGMLLIFVGLVGRKLWLKEKWTFHAHLRVPNLIQAFVQSSILIFMSLYSPYVTQYAPLILAQIAFAFGVDFLVSIARYRSYRFGFSVLPIVLSTNLFIWFQPRLIALQFVMVMLGVLSKHYIQHTLNGQRSHVFNPSGIGMFAGALFLLFMGNEYSWFNYLTGSYNVARPDIFLWILLMGCISQITGGIFLISLGAALTLFTLCNLTEILIGVPMTNQWIDPAVLVGITLLITDPTTTPKTPWGRFLFGCTYGIGILVSYGMLSYFRSPGYFAKILPVPFLNLLAPSFDRIPALFHLRGREQWVEKTWVQAAVYILVLLILLPSANRPRQPSLLGSLGGTRWSVANRR